MKFKFTNILKYLKCKEGDRHTNTQREREREAQQWENSNKEKQENSKDHAHPKRIKKPKGNWHTLKTQG